MAFIDRWATPLGPFAADTTPSVILFDPVTDHAFVIGSDGAEKVRVKKIVRSTFTVDSAATFAGYNIYPSHPATQDNDYLYICTSEFPGNDSYIKVQKSDLSFVHVAAAVPNHTFPGQDMALHIGPTGTWSAGYVWGIVETTDSPLNYRLVAWNITTGAVFSNTGIPEPTVGGETQTAFAQSVFDSNGDLWIVSDQLPDSPSHAILTKVTSGPTFATPILLSNVFTSENNNAEGLAYDAVNNALIIISPSLDPFSFPEWSMVARYDIDTDTVTYAQNYLGLNTTAHTSLGTEGNGLRDVLGVPSVFIAWSDISADDATAPYSNTSVITHYNHETGELLHFFPFEGGVIDTYNSPNNLALSPEGELWMTSGAGVWADMGQEYIHKLDIEGSLSTVQGYISFSEMEIPEASGGGTHWLRPTYGRGYGKGYGDSYG